MKEGILFAALLTALVVVLGVTIIVDDGVNINAVANGVPSEIIEGCPSGDEAGIISGYVDGREDAKAGLAPSCLSIPESYWSGYASGYSDYSELTVTEAAYQSQENAWSTIREENVNIGDKK